LNRARKIVLLVALYLAQGLPFGFFTVALPVVLREAGYSLTAISALSLLYLPWVLKFLWASFVDRVGARRTWLLSLQLASIAAALLLAQLDIKGNLPIVLAAAFVFNAIAATQDIVTDGLAVRMLDTHERGLGNGIQVGAYRGGMILGGGLLLWVFAQSTWSLMFTCMALLLTLSVLPVLGLHEPQREAERPSATATYLLAGWMKRLMLPGMLGTAALVFCYRFGDQMVSTLWGPFLSDFGLSKESIALMKGTIGSMTSLLGAFVGGWFTFAVGRRRALLVSGLAQGACFVLYILAAAKIGGVSMLWYATILEGVIGTMATVALFTFMMDASDPTHAGTDYTLLASVVVLVGSIGNVAAALIADALGYLFAFAIGAVLSVMGCLTLVTIVDRHPLSGRIAIAWRKAQ
jgi:MFS family permease